MEEGNLAKWHVKVGDKVKPGDVIAEIETDKATMEVEAVDEGTVTKLLVEEGAQGVKVNAVIAELSGEGEAAPKGNGGTKAEAPKAAPAKVEAKPETKPAVAERRHRRRQAAAPLRPLQAAERAPAPVVAKGGERVKASPLARRLAQQQGVDLLALKGSGPAWPDREERCAEGARRAARRSRARSAPGSLIEPATIDERVYLPDTYELLPLDGVRKVTAKRLTQSFMQVPHFPLHDRSRDRPPPVGSGAHQRGGRRGRRKISVNDMLIKACAMSLMAQPDANASYTDKGIVMHKSAHVSVAVAIPGGLITPVVRDAQTKGLAHIAAEMKDLAARARERKLKPAGLHGRHVLDLQPRHVRHQGLRLDHQPARRHDPLRRRWREACCGEGRSRSWSPPMMTVTLTCDHRVVDGATGAKWLQHFKQFVETPEAMLL